MPGFDGTGPRGMGPMTGGGRGFCSPWGIGAASTGYGTPPRVRYGYPYYGWAREPYRLYGMPTGALGAMPFAPQTTREQELEVLKAQSQALAQQLSEIQRRIEELNEKKR